MSYLSQDDDPNARFRRIEIDMHNALLMLQALCEAEGIEASSITSGSQDTSSNMSSPHGTSDISLQFEGSDHDSSTDDPQVL